MNLNDTHQTPDDAKPNNLPILTLALSKGRIFDETLPFLEKAGIFIEENKAQSRRLILQTSLPNLRILMLRASDVITYVEHGAADIGIAGFDILQEHTILHSFILQDLAIAKCRLSVATTNTFDYFNQVKQGSRLRVATKYIEQTQKHFADKGVHVDIIKLYGSMELAPVVGLADVIVDVVSSGNTLKQNDLREVEFIRNVSSYLIANKASYYNKFKQLYPMIELFKQA